MFLLGCGQCCKLTRLSDISRFLGRPSARRGCGRIEGYSALCDALLHFGSDRQRMNRLLFIRVSAHKVYRDASTKFLPKLKRFG